MNEQIIYLVENSEMNIDFENIETNILDELKELINKYTDRYNAYKNRKIHPFTEMKKIFGEKNDLIFKPKSDDIYNFIEKPKPNLDLWNAHKNLFYKNFDKAELIRKQLQEQKRKADVKAYLYQKKVCDICQGKYFMATKARHYKTQKHIKCEN
jgi:hypothetical protein